MDNQVHQGDEVYALSEMVDHLLLLEDFYGPLKGANPGVVGLVERGSPFAHLKTKRAAAEEHLERHFLGIQQALEERDLENAYWLPGTENPADGLTEVRGDVVPLLELLESGEFARDIFAP